ncbi:MAG: PH domain-containing protein [Corallococcus sp.]|nr:PH domain-containing protein [Corallococcus sp.]MCM1359803.1 PH domain-containing protein [Corallococcus sp.]MCM1395237.1 PH domain-containing protein [Corallococcus sp.]
MNIDEKYFRDSEFQKNSIDDVVNADEKILWRGKPNAKSYVLAAMMKMLPIAMLWLAVDGVFIYFMAAGMSAGDIPLAVLGFIIPFFALHLTPVWIWIVHTVKAFREVKNIEYAITDRRIIIRSGLIGIDFKFVNYTEIDSVNIRVGLIDRIFKVGDIYVNASTNSAVLWDVTNPYQIGKALQKVTMDIKSDVYYPNALRPEENPGYKTGYTDDPFDDRKF